LAVAGSSMVLPPNGEVVVRLVKDGDSLFLNIT
jgi:hypothetical protein